MVICNVGTVGIGRGKLYNHRRGGGGDRQAGAPRHSDRVLLGGLYGPN